MWSNSSHGYPWDPTGTHGITHWGPHGVLMGIQMGTMGSHCDPWDPMGEWLPKGARGQMIVPRRIGPMVSQWVLGTGLPKGPGTNVSPKGLGTSSFPRGSWTDFSPRMSGTHGFPRAPWDKQFPKRDPMGSQLEESSFGCGFSEFPLPPPNLNTT
jgi:hypothetical protein